MTFVSKSSSPLLNSQVKRRNKRSRKQTWPKLRLESSWPFWGLWRQCCAKTPQGRPCLRHLTPFTRSPAGFSTHITNHGITIISQMPIQQDGVAIPQAGGTTRSGNNLDG